MTKDSIWGLTADQALGRGQDQIYVERNLQPLGYRAHLVGLLRDYILGVRGNNSVQTMLESLSEIYIAAEECFRLKDELYRDGARFSNNRERSKYIARMSKQSQILNAIAEVIGQGAQATQTNVEHAVDGLVSHLAMDVWSRNLQATQRGAE